MVERKKIPCFSPKQPLKNDSARKDIPFSTVSSYDVERKGVDTILHKTKEIIIRLVFLCLALCIIGLGGAMFLYSNLGADPYNMLAQGLAALSGLQVGTISNLMQLVFLVFLLVCWREKLHVGTLFATFLIGGSLNFFYGLFQSLSTTPGWTVRIICVTIASFIIGFGVALIQLADIGMVPNDVMPLYIHRKLPRFQFRTIRICYDATQLVFGLLLGGVLGVGTILCTLLTGPVIQFTVTRLRATGFRYFQPRAGV